MSKYWSLAALTLAGNLLLSQYQFRQINHLRSIRLDAELYRLDLDYHTAVQPINLWARDSLLNAYPFPEAPGRSWLVRKGFFEDLLRVESKDYALTFNPVVNLQLGGEGGQGAYRYLNTRGFMIEGRIGQKLTFYSSYLENQGRFAEYFNTYTAFRRVVPGQGSVVRAFGSGGFDFGLPSGEVSYTPSRFFTLTAGQGRNFFGEGYRSMFLSDAAFNYPFFRIQTSFWKIKYVNLWAKLNDIRPEVRLPGSDAVYARKYLSSHYLSINLSTRWNLSFFEAIVLGDSLQQRSIDAAFFNPVIFYRPIEFAVGSGRGNALMGLGSSYKVWGKAMFYGQFILDEFQLSSLTAGEGSWVNKYGWQLGFKDYQAFGVEGLFVRAEYNSARPYTFSHREVLTNYGHYGGHLAHPWGANFQEFVFQGIYQQGRWEFDLQANLGRIGLDSLGSNWGTDIYLPYTSREQELGNRIGQGLQGNLLYLHGRLAYWVNPKTGLKFEIGMRYRRLQAPGNLETSPVALSETTWGFVGLRTELFNRYYDR